MNVIKQILAISVLASVCMSSAAAQQVIVGLDRTVLPIKEPVRQTETILR